jgi:hypothetical protein
MAKDDLTYLLQLGPTQFSQTQRMVDEVLRAPPALVRSAEVRSHLDALAAPPLSAACVGLSHHDNLFSLAPEDQQALARVHASDMRKAKRGGRSAAAGEASGAASASSLAAAAAGGGGEETPAENDDDADRGRTFGPTPALGGSALPLVHPNSERVILAAPTPARGAAAPGKTPRKPAHNVIPDTPSDNEEEVNGSGVRSSALSDDDEPASAAKAVDPPPSPGPESERRGDLPPSADEPEEKNEEEGGSSCQFDDEDDVDGAGPPAERVSLGAGRRAASFLGTVSPRLSIGGIGVGGGRTSAGRRISMGLRIFDLTRDSDGGERSEGEKEHGDGDAGAVATSVDGEDALGLDGSMDGAGNREEEEQEAAGGSRYPLLPSARDACHRVLASALDALPVHLPALNPPAPPSAASPAAPGAEVGADPLTLLRALHAAAKLGLLRPPPPPEVAVVLIEGDEES